jgi:hypothetical protein
MAAMRVENPNRAALERAAPDPADALIPTPAPTAHARTHHGWGLRSKPRPSQRGPRPPHRAIAHALLEPPAHLTPPVLPRDFGAA